jgi:Tol biopolymer transport system component
MILFDATSGAQGVTVDDAFFPLMMPDGSKVIFLPDGNGSGSGDRDPTVNSVWSYDTASTVERRLIRFTNADRVPLNLALSPKGRLVAITHGNDADLFQWDIWTARIDEHRTRRLTHDGDSLYPAFSPGGKKIAFTKKDGTKACRGAIWIMNIDGSGAHRVVAGTCARSLMRPVWLNATTLAAWWWVTEGGITTINGLVTIDLPSGNVHGLAKGDILDYSVSRSLGILAYRESDGSITIYDIGSGTKTPGPDATLPKGPRVFLSGALELAY